MLRTYASRSIVVGLFMLLCIPSRTWAQVAPPLGTSAQFGVLGNSAVTGSAGGGVVVNGDVGSSPTPTISNFPPSRTVAPFIVHAANDGVVQQAHTDAIAAYNALLIQGAGTVLADNLATVGALGPGIYSFVTGTPDLPAGATLTLNGGGVFIFNVGNSLTANVLSNVVGTANPCNIYWRIGTSATLNGNNFLGTVIANASITVGAGANLAGRALAGTGATGAVTMAGAGGNTIGGCSTPAAVPSPTVVCPPGVGTPPTITAIPNQTIPVSGSASVGFTISGAVITDALLVSATSSDGTLVPPGAMVITKGAGGARVLTVSGANGRSGVANITVTVTDPTSTGCALATSTTFQLTVGAAAVPTLPEWAMIALMALLAVVGVAAMRRRAA